MKSLKRLGVTLALTFVLAVAAFAGETPTPPCSSPEPGQTSTPPCVAAQMSQDDSAVPGEVNAPPAANTGSEFSLSEMALSLVQSVLSIF